MGNEPVHTCPKQTAVAGLGGSQQVAGSLDLLTTRSGAAQQQWGEDEHPLHIQLTERGDVPPQAAGEEQHGQTEGRRDGRTD